MDTIRTGRLELVPLSGPFIEAVRGGNLAAAEREIGAAVSRWLTIDSTHLVQLNLAQRTADAVGLETPGWAMVLVPQTGSGRVIGSIGFHGPPDERGRLELGYAVDPAFSREGYAAEAMTALLDWAAKRYGITGFLVAVPSSHAAVAEAIAAGSDVLLVASLTPVFRAAAAIAGASVRGGGVRRPAAPGRRATGSRRR